MKFLRFFLLLPLLCIALYGARAQTDSVQTPQIKALSRAMPDSIMLRWAPDQAMAWEYANEYGYIIKRYTILRDGEVLDNPPSVTLTDDPIKPLPLPQWEPIVQDDKYAAIAAQAIHGETFEVSQNFNNNIMEVYQKNKELEQRFSFALMAADLSLKAAKASGLWYTDTTAKENEKYLYRIISQVPDDVYKLDTGIAYTGIQDYAPLPEPVKLSGEFKDKKVMLSWNREYFTRTYNAFIIERATESPKNFKRIQDVPVTNTYPDKDSNPRRMYKMDTLPANNKKFYYRIRGVNAFGQEGPPSDTISGMGHRALTTTPVIEEMTNLNDSAIRINWRFPDSLNQSLRGFRIMRAFKESGTYELMSDTLPVDTRSWTDHNPVSSNYYEVQAITKYGPLKSSMVRFAQLQDSIPPAAPTGLEGKVDTTGKVTLHWHPNTEQDLHGYRVFRSNFDTHEYTQITSGAVQDTIFSDSININTLTEDIYYKIRAVDHRYNPSEFSEPAKLKRPDVIPPVSPVFASVESTEKGIQLSWNLSSSDDVENHLLYRTHPEMTDWVLINTIDTATSYFDEEVVGGRPYAYTLIAVDDAGLESEPTDPITGKKPENMNKPPVTSLDFEVDRDAKTVQLQWQYAQEGVKRYYIYKKRTEQPLRLFTSVGQNNNQFVDDQLEANNNYTYRIQAVFESGAQSSFSEPLNVEF